MVNVDLRGFDYRLAPALQRQQWKRDATQRQLAQAQQAVQLAKQTVNALITHDQQQRDSNSALNLLHDPASYSRLLGWMVQSKEKIQLAQQSLAAAQQCCAQLLQQCALEQQKTAVLEQHRQEQLIQFLQDEQRRQAVGADEDWLSRQRYGSSAIEQTW